MAFLEVEPCPGQRVFNVMHDSVLKGRVRSFDGWDILGDVRVHEAVQFVSHSWILIIGKDLVDGPGEMAGLVDTGQAVLGVERRF
jgi:hypothetical protein